MADQQSYSRIYTLKAEGTDKIIADVNKVIASYEALGDISSEVSANMQKSAQSLGANLTAATIGVNKMQAATVNAAETSVYYSNSIVELGGRLFELKEAAQATRDQLKILGDEYKNNAISQEEYEQEGALLTAQLTQQNLLMTQTTALMKALNSSEFAYAGSVKDARAQITLLNREQENLIVLRTKDVQITDEEIAANVARRDAIIAEKNALHDFVAANADKNLARVLNIGNYPTATAEFSALKQQMQQLVLAGEAEGAEFKKLEARALELSAAIKEVGVATATSTTVGEKFGNIVEKMGLRMIANLIIFQAAIEVAQYLWESWTKDSKAAAELAKNIQDLDNSAHVSAQKEISDLQVLNSIATDHNEKMDIRLRAVKEMQDKYPDYLGNLSKEKILTGETADELVRLNEALINKALSEAAIGKIGELGKQYFELNHQLKELQKQLIDTTSTSQYNKGLTGTTDTANKITQKQIDETKKKMDDLKLQMEEFQKEAQEFASKAAPLIVDQPDKPKKEKKEKTPEENLKKFWDEVHRQYVWAIQSRDEYDAELKKRDTDEIERTNVHLATQQRLTQESYDKDLLLLSQSYADKKITEEQYESDKRKLKRGYDIDNLNETIDYLQKEVNAAKISNEAKKKLLDEIAAYKHKLNQEIVVGNEDGDKKELLNTKQIYNTAIGVISNFANMEMQILEKQDAFREAMAQRGLERSKKVADSETQSNNEKIATDKAYTIAQEQLEKEKAENAKRRAEQQIVVNYAVALMKAFADSDDPVSKIEGAIAASAAFAFSEAELASAPAYADGTANHPGGFAVVGDGGEPELAKIGGSYYVTPSTPTLVNMPSGSSVTPFSHISNLGAGLQAPRFNSTSSGGGADHASSFQAIHSSLQTIAAHMANQRVSLDTHKLGTKMNNNHYKQVKL